MSLTAKELLGKDFLYFLVHSHPQLRAPVSGWLEQVKSAGTGLTTQQQLELLCKAVPAETLRATQEDFISKGKPSAKQAASSGSSSLAAAAAAMQPGPGSRGSLSQLTPQQLLALRAQAPVQAAAQPGAWPALVQQPPARTVSPAPTSQQAGTAAAAQNQQTLLQLLAQNPHLAQQARALNVTATPAGAIRAPGLPSVGSAGNLAALNQAAAAAAAAAAGGASLQRPGSIPGRPLGSTGPGAAGLYGRPGVAPAGPDPDAGLKAQVYAVMRALKPNEPPKQEAPDGCEWVQCTGKDGKPGWFAVVRAKAAVLRAAAKRKADEVPAGQPASKQGGRGKAAADDELVAGGGPLSMNVMDEDAVEAEEAAAKATIVVEAGNVQEEYLLSNTATMRLVALAAKEAGVKAVSDSVYPYLSLAAEAYLNQLLNGMVKMRLQREDLGKGYFGFEQGDTSLRADLYKHREREKREAEKRAEMERDELAKLGTSRKKLGEEERKAAQAAKQQRDIEQKRANVGNTLSMLGIRHQGFSSMGKAPTRTGASKPGFTKAELADVKAAADPQAPTTPAAAAAAAAASSAPDAAAAAAAAGAVKAEAGAAADAQQPGAAAAPGSQGLQPTPGASTAAAAAGPSPAALKAMTLQHQLLTTADVASQVTSFVAGGVGPSASRKVREGDAAPPRELMLADLVAVLERHPLYCRSPQLYTLYTLAALQADNAASK